MKSNYTILDQDLGAVVDIDEYVLVNLNDNTVYDREAFEAVKEMTIEEYLSGCDIHDWEQDTFETNYLKYPSCQLGYEIRKQ